MILFIFEGASYEPSLYEGIKSLFFPKSNDQVLCSFCSSIYTFYKRLKDEFDGFADVVDVLKIELAKTDPRNELFKYKSADFESIYLFFDYDFYRGDLKKKNAQIKELLKYFNEETDYGRLFISYPMIESIQYTKELPDNDFHSYTAKRNECVGEKFKREARLFCYYKGYAFLKDTQNWAHIIRQNVFKANNLTTGSLTWPLDKDNVMQEAIFEAQLQKHVIPHDEVAILNAFPMFLYYYFPIEKFSGNK
ncbi:MAG: hypothetical protein IJP70_08005 [Bacteroidales bacterium]|nr:hypothetical protein [Bacteroidales bacterium]